MTSSEPNRAAIWALAAIGLLVVLALTFLLAFDGLFHCSENESGCTRSDGLAGTLALTGLLEGLIAAPIVIGTALLLSREGARRGAATMAAVVVATPVAMLVIRVIIETVGEAIVG